MTSPIGYRGRERREKKEGCNGKEWKNGGRKGRAREEEGRGLEEKEGEEWMEGGKDKEGSEMETREVHI